MTEALRRKIATLEAKLEAKDFTIRCLRDEIRRLRPELKDCIASTSLADLQRQQRNEVGKHDPLGPLKSS